jgi:hypothetical protein
MHREMNKTPFYVSAMQSANITSNVMCKQLLCVKQNTEARINIPLIWKQMAQGYTTYPVDLQNMVLSGVGQLRCECRT